MVMGGMHYRIQLLRYWLLFISIYRGRLVNGGPQRPTAFFDVHNSLTFLDASSVSSSNGSSDTQNDVYLLQQFYSGADCTGNKTYLFAVQLDACIPYKTVKEDVTYSYRITGN